MEIISAYDTEIAVDSSFTPDFLGELFAQHFPVFMGWFSVPDEDDPTGENWIPDWFDISEALAELDRVLDGGGLSDAKVDGFTEADTREELEMFRAELREAQNHTKRFFLSVYFFPVGLLIAP